jgi:hypothetical protein
MRLSNREAAATRTARINGCASNDFKGLLCCCPSELLNALREGRVECRVGQVFVTVCCKNRLVHREGGWQWDRGARS